MEPTPGSGMFHTSGGAYDSFMGRYSRPLAVLFADSVGIFRGQSALDVGCGPGALTGVLVDRLDTRCTGRERIHERAIVDKPLQARAERLGGERVIQQPMDAVLDEPWHAADARTDDRQAVHEGLVNNEW